MSDPDDLVDAIRAELRALIAAGIGLAERAQTLAARVEASPDPVLADREHKVRMSAQEDLEVYLRDLHAVLAAMDGRNPHVTGWDYDEAVRPATDVSGGEPAPEELREVAETAAGLLERTEALLEVNPGLILARAIDYLTAFADRITRFEDLLVRRKVGQASDCCAMPWGICPDHGNTLRSSGSEC